MTTVSWVCSYTPRELFRALGFGERRLWGVDPRGSALPHLAANLCGYSRACLAQASGEERPEVLVVAGSCHALIHLYAALQLEGLKNLFFLPLPRLGASEAEEFFAAVLRRLAEELAAVRGGRMDEERLKEELRVGVRERREKIRLFREPVSGFSRYLYLRGEGKDLTPARSGFPRLALTGSPPPPRLLQLVEECGGCLAVEDCCGAYRDLYFPEVGEAEDPFLTLARLYLRRPPCPRMVGDRARRFKYLQELIRDFRVEGIVYHTVKFCDHALYELAAVRRWAEKEGIPLLWVETEYGEPGEQVRVRLAAFVEMLAARRESL
ncbi:2-hydroxyacyl-CoA dehydratase subunit D [Ammonifex thiophilus]|uniref:2-hydroxyacyl-CoA dehydratase n=1 Tax=Ammonifex thiophilus TaxID=444093 RepID=A0A3D8P5F5_9THEO|nr:2-hydroxyacyl-CoA dehydratase family protein [Ammonifex thiophilus]RDV83210.1 2-hydroxyacyl-CoA dehydratase [Ammonifex thiophilus]